MSQVNPKITNIPINAKGGALTLISGTILSSKVEIMEDPAYNAGVAQGLTGYYMDPLSKGNPQKDFNSTLQVWLPNSAGQIGRAYEPIIFGGADGRVHGALGNYAAADGEPIVEITTNSATAGGVLLVEWP